MIRTKYYLIAILYAVNHFFIELNSYSFLKILFQV